MFKTENEVTNWIYSFRINKANRNLSHLHRFLASIGNPHLKLKTIHVAGTNGKGSTVSYLCQALMEAGYKVATFTSPFITCFGERMSINKHPMPETKLIHHANRLKELLPTSTSKYTSFDIITLISFLYFSEENVDIAIYETGIGGRLDSTNVIMPLIAAITNVGHDHADVLGETQLERAMEKLGIVKEGIPLVTTEADPDLISEFKKVCAEKETTLYLPLIHAKLLAIDETGAIFSWGPYKKVQIGMHGRHQFKNALLAMFVLEYLYLYGKFKDVNPAAISKARWQGRFEQVRIEPPVVLDGAHNIEGIEALVDTVRLVYPHHKPIYVFSAIGTKDAKTMLEMLDADAYNVVTTAGTHPNSIDPEILANYTKEGWFEHEYKTVIRGEIEEMEADQVLIFCGSLYFIADVRKYLFGDGRFLL